MVILLLFLFVTALCWVALFALYTVKLPQDRPPFWHQLGIVLGLLVTLLAIYSLWQLL
jgi:hypothetical protein